eukprot:Gb_41049 [translate_table: standard]
MVGTDAIDMGMTLPEWILSGNGLCTRFNIYQDMCSQFGQVPVLAYPVEFQLGDSVTDENNVLGQVALSAFDKDADLDVMNHPIVDFIYYMLVEILPSALVLYILRKLPPKRMSAYPGNGQGTGVVKQSWFDCKVFFNSTPHADILKMMKTMVYGKTIMFGCNISAVVFPLSPSNSFKRKCSIDVIVKFTGDEKMQIDQDAN